MGGKDGDRERERVGACVCVRRREREERIESERREGGRRRRALRLRAETVVVPAAFTGVKKSFCRQFLSPISTRKLFFLFVIVIFIDKNLTSRSTRETSEKEETSFGNPKRLEESFRFSSCFLSEDFSQKYQKRQKKIEGKKIIM